jgi:cytochrome d ubiquinol oxidase subunit II
MTTFWYGLFGALLATYFALGGLNIGVGLLLVGQRGATPQAQDVARRDALNALGPRFLGNEVWIVGAIGVLIAAFPRIEGGLFDSLYPLVVLIVLGLVGLNAGVQLRSRPDDLTARRRFDLLIIASAAVLALGWGALVGNLLTGLPLGGGAVLVTGVFPVLTALALAALLAAHGAAYLGWRLPTDAGRTRARALGVRLALLAAALVAGAVALGTAGDGVRAALNHGRPAAVLSAVLVGALLMAALAQRLGRPGVAVIGTALAAALPVVLAGVGLFPHVLVSTADPLATLTVAQAAATPALLRTLGFVLLPVVPLLVALQVSVWWLFRADSSTPTSRYW